VCLGVCVWFVSFSRVLLALDIGCVRVLLALDIGSRSSLCISGV
jgi:hypothetical protein